MYPLIPTVSSITPLHPPSCSHAVNSSKPSQLLPPLSCIPRGNSRKTPQ